MVGITAVIATLNEEGRIEERLKSVSWVDEIIVVDSYSEDKTVDIAKEYADKIIQEESEGYMEPHRITGIEAASNKYILRIDADEEFPESLMEIIERKSEENVDILYAPRKNIQAGRWVKACGAWPSYVPVLFKKEAVELKNRIHRSIEPKSDVAEEYLEPREDIAIIHRTTEDFSDWFSTQIRYSSIEVKQSEISGGILLPVLKEFFRRYIYMKGFLRGREGLVLSLMNAQGQFMKQMMKYEKEGKWEDE